MLKTHIHFLEEFIIKDCHLLSQVISRVVQHLVSTENKNKTNVMDIRQSNSAMQPW